MKVVRLVESVASWRVVVGWEERKQEDREEKNI